MASRLLHFREVVLGTTGNLFREVVLGTTGDLFRGNGIGTIFTEEWKEF